MVNKVRDWAAKILRPTSGPRIQPNETWVGCRRRTSESLRRSCRKMGLPLLTQKIAREIWTTVTWAVYNGDVPIMLALRSLFGVENDRLVEKLGILVYGVGPLTTFHGGSTRLVSTIGEYSGTHRWQGGPAKGGIGSSYTAQQIPRKEDAIRSLLESMKQAVEKKTEPNGSRPQKTKGPDSP